MRADDTGPLWGLVGVGVLLAGTAGDLTASRKVKLSEPELSEPVGAAEPAPEPTSDSRPLWLILILLAAGALLLRRRRTS